MAERIFWFLVGGCVSFVLNAGSYKLFYFHLGWHHSVAYLCSLGLTMLFFFFWNYFLNFRTDTCWRGAAWKYVVSQVVMFSLNYAIVGLAYRWGVGKWWLNILVTPFFLTPLKFTLYHKWVFPKALEPTSQ